MDFIVNILKTNKKCTNIEVLNNIEHIVNENIILVERVTELLYYHGTIKTCDIKINIYTNNITNIYQINIIYKSHIKYLKYKEMNKNVVKEIILEMFKLKKHEDTFISSMLYKLPLCIRKFKMKRKHKLIKN